MPPNFNTTVNNAAAAQADTGPNRDAGAGTGRGTGTGTGRGAGTGTGTGTGGGTGAGGGRGRGGTRRAGTARPAGDRGRGINSDNWRAGPGRNQGRGGGRPWGRGGAGGPRPPGGGGGGGSAGRATAYRTPGPIPSPSPTPSPSYSSDETTNEDPAPQATDHRSRTLQGRVSKPAQRSSVKAAQPISRSVGRDKAENGLWRESADALQAAIARETQVETRGTQGQKRKRQESLLGDMISALDEARKKKR
ncbi:hypothetical protein F5Y06DRAFT_151112 [Hypoxylon sp. FL0890]|nr:hypothetical protein F5Y06DRAFT_151112 [Hypoxylon sp. FL0890]